MATLLRRLILPGNDIFRPALLRFYNAKTADATSVPSSVSLSDNCVKRLKELVSSDPGGSFLRVAVEGGGCSGFQYKFDMDNKMQEDDRVFEKEGAKVVIDETTLEYIKGSTIDYHTELIRSAFRIVSNPKAEHGCSCGASFSVKID